MWQKSQQKYLRVQPVSFPSPQFECQKKVSDLHLLHSHERHTQRRMNTGISILRLGPDGKLAMDLAGPAERRYCSFYRFRTFVLHEMAHLFTKARSRRPH